MGAAIGQSAARQSDLTGSIGSIQRRFALTLGWVLLVLPLVGAAAQAAAGADIFTPRQLSLNLGTAFAGLIALMLVRRGRINAAGIVASVIFFAAAFFISQNEIRLLLTVLGVIVAATLTTSQFFVAAAVIATVPFFRTLLEVIQQTGFSTADRGVEAVAGIGITVVVAVVFRYLFDITQRTTVTAERSFRRLASVADIGRQTSRLTALETLLHNSVNTIQEQFGFYHVQIFWWTRSASSPTLSRRPGRRAANFSHGATASSWIPFGYRPCDAVQRLRADQRHPDRAGSRLQRAAAGHPR